MPISAPGTPHYCNEDDVRAVKPEILTTKVRTPTQVNWDIYQAEGTFNAAIRPYYQLTDGYLSGDIDPLVRTIVAQLAAAYGIIGSPSIQGYSAIAKGIRDAAWEMIEKLQAGELAIDHDVQTGSVTTGVADVVIDTGPSHGCFDRDRETEWQEPDDEMDDPGLEGESVW